MQKINTTDEFTSLLQNHNKFLLLKNSTTCPISQQAFEEFSQFAEKHPEETFYLNVQEARPLSNEIAEKFEVKHESPQVLLFSAGKVVWDTSHWNVTVTNLQTEWEK